MNIYTQNAGGWGWAGIGRGGQRREDEVCFLSLYPSVSSYVYYLQQKSLELLWPFVYILFFFFFFQFTFFFYLSVISLEGLQVIFSFVEGSLIR